MSSTVESFLLSRMLQSSFDWLKRHWNIEKRVTDLENAIKASHQTQIAKMEKWDREKSRYFLKDLGYREMAYAIKEDARGEEPTHYLCASCYNKEQKSILQPRRWGDKTLYECHCCSKKITGK